MTWANLEGEWRHRPWWKVAINTTLRALQTRRRPARLFVVVTVCTEDGDPPRVLGYRFGKVTHR